MIGWSDHLQRRSDSDPAATVRLAPRPNEPEYNYYKLFGGVLRSDVEVPELTRTPRQPAQWTLRSTSDAVQAYPGEHLGSDTVNEFAQVHMHRVGAGLRMCFSDTGTFDITADGRSITWYRPKGRISLRDFRADLTSRVMAAALHLAGTMCLHASAVVLEGQAIGLVAPKRHGKSTLALALVQSGARLLTDDTLPVQVGPPPTAGAGLHATRLWSDSARRVGLGTPRRGGGGEKVLFSELPEEMVSHATAPLGALYLLSPTMESPGGEAAWRTRISAVESALILIAHSKLAPLLKGSEAPMHFRTAVRLAQEIPVYRLNIVRDLDRLSDVVQVIRDWHRASRASCSAEGDRR